MNWWQRLRNQDRLERELDAELRYHFDREVADNVRMGMSEKEARRRARIDSGGDAPLKERCRDARGTRWVEDIAQDLRSAARLLVKDHRFTTPAVLALALGIGMNGTMFTVVNAMIRGLPIDSPERILLPDGFSFPIVSDMWQPLTRLPGLRSQARDMRQLQVVGRLADWSTAAQAQAEIESIAARLSRKYPSTNGNTGALVAPFPGHFAPSVSSHTRERSWKR